MSDALDRARKAMETGFFVTEGSQLARVLGAFTDLLAEHDAGLWLDTREIDALLAKRMWIDGGIDGGVVVIDYEHELVAHGATTADAVRAAAEALDAAEREAS